MSGEQAPTKLAPVQNPKSSRVSLLLTVLYLAFSCSGIAQLPTPNLKSVFPPGGQQGATLEVELGEGEVSILGANGLVHSTARQADGRIIIGGEFTSVSGVGRNYVARLRGDGSTDTSYNVGEGANGVVLSVALQSDGKALIGGKFTTINGVKCDHIARLNPDGNVDPGFQSGVSNSSTEGSTNQFSSISSITPQSDGKTLVVDDVSDAKNGERKLVVRLNSNGSIDQILEPNSQASTNDSQVAHGAEMTTKLYFSHPGISAEQLPQTEGKRWRFKVRIDPKVAPGHYDVRLITELGISNPRTFVISDYCEALEQEPNDLRDNATPATMDATINGKISPAEDVDWFVFSAQKGQRVILQSKGWSIDSRLDAVMWLYDSNGVELARSLDENIYSEKRDPLIDFEVPSNGVYYVKLTDFLYNGNEEHVYRLSITTNIPFIDFIAPAGIKPGTSQAVTIFGRNLPEAIQTDQRINDCRIQKVIRQITADNLNGLHINEVIRPCTTLLDGMEVRIKSDTGSSNGKFLLFSPFTELLNTNRTAAKDPQPIHIPFSVSGQFSKANEFHRYTFVATKGKTYAIQVLSESIGSPAEPQMELRTPEGRVFTNFQQAVEPIAVPGFSSASRDIWQSFIAPLDGDYTLLLNHLFRQKQGGPQFLYRLELQSDPRPDFQLICQPAYGALPSGQINSFVVYRGGRQRMDIVVWRLHGHKEPIIVEAQDLPRGVTAEPIVIGSGVKSGILVVTAEADAPMSEAEIQILGRSIVQDQKIQRKARGSIIVWPGTLNAPAMTRTVRSITLAVRDKSPFVLTASPAELNVQAGDPIQVTVAVKKWDNLTNSILLSAATQLAPGLEVPSTNLGPGQIEAQLTLNTAKISPGGYSLVINGEGQVASSDKAKRIYPSNPIKLVILPKKSQTKQSTSP
jgi:uncharacterized delta-60 repeat protein